MRLVTFKLGDAGRARVGAMTPCGNYVVDLSATLPVDDMRQFLEGGASFLARARAAVAAGGHRHPVGGAGAGGGVTLLAPISNPEKLLCVGMNYREHCTEQNYPIPDEPLIFSKFASSITGTGADIHFDSRMTHKMDWEVELCIVVGKEVPRNCPEADVMAHIAGFTVAHDVSARDWQLEKNGGQWLLGKTMDTFSPIGPAIVTTDEMDAERIGNVGIRCFVNGVKVQDSNTNEIIFDTRKLIAWISRFVTLKPGDLIFTGTPSGVGCFRKPPVWLKHGDTVVCEIDGLGKITNSVVDDAVAASQHSKL